MEKPDTFAQAIERLRQRRKDWVAAHPKQTVRVEFRTGGADWIIADLITAVEKGFIKFNQDGFDMIRFMVLAEANKFVTFNMVRAAIDDDFYNENKEHFGDL